MQKFKNFIQILLFYINLSKEHILFKLVLHQQRQLLLAGSV